MDNLFPFYVLLNADLSVLNSGRSINKIIDVSRGKYFFDLFKIHLPIGISSFESIVKQQTAVFIFHDKLDSNNKFRGQIYFDKKHKLLCFLGGPLLNSLDDLNSKKLILNDFAIHDSISQFLFTLQIQSSSLNDSKILAEKLKKSNINLKVINESLDIFTYRLTHDLRAPAVNIHNMLKMLGKTIDIPTKSKTETIYNHAQKSIDKLLETIEDFLELSKAEKARTSISEVCNLSEIVKEITESLQPTISDSNTSIIMDLATEEVFMVKEDLKSILLNLINNSIKYKSGKRPPVINIKTILKNNTVHLFIIDNGMGIDLETHQDKVFKMFNRFHISTEISGSGIGLYLVKKLIEKNNGTITLESKLNKGTIFRINLPSKK